MPPSDLFSGSRYLYLHRICEPAENEVTTRLLEAMTELSPSDKLSVSSMPQDLNIPLALTRAIMQREGCRIFEISRESHIGYAVREESDASREPETSTHAGGFFVEYMSSSYLAI